MPCQSRLAAGLLPDRSRHGPDADREIDAVCTGRGLGWCTPASLAQPGEAASGTQAGPARIRVIAEAAGFGRFRIAARTPFNNVDEIWP